MNQQANESDVKTLHPLATAHRPKNYNKLEAYEGKYKNPIQQLRSMMPNRGKYNYLFKDNSLIVLKRRNVV